MYPMRRSDREQGEEFALSLIDHCSHGVMSIHTSEAFPYCLPLSFVRNGNCLYFHCAKAGGRKLDLLHANPNVCIYFRRGGRAGICRAQHIYYLFSVCHRYWHRR